MDPMQRDITPAEAKRLLEEQPSYRYLDVRTVSEFIEGHPPGACNVPVVEMDGATGRFAPNPRFLEVASAMFDKDAQLIVGCKSGGRSAHAVELLTQAGFSNCCNMLGGFGGAQAPDGSVATQGWSQLGYPVATDNGDGVSYESLQARAAAAS